ncbi:MAG: NAD(P)H-dependent oxidoreductase [Turneriella sp.]|nr:NAD(P)H-dependent oxidoreductase [Turneriella sp.]
MKQILVIMGHPSCESLCAQLAATYRAAALAAGAQVTLLELAKLKFDLNLNAGYRGEQPLEPDLVKAQHLIAKADHLVFIFPSWWASMPALLKGFLDRVFLPGFAFKYRSDSPFPEKLLRGKTARIIITMDAPAWYYKWFNGAPGLRLLKFATLEFCGVKPVKYNLFGPVRKAPERRLQGFIAKTAELGRRMA